MYSQINCNANCKFQIDGECIKSTTIKNENNLTRKECVFFCEKKSKANSNNDYNNLWTNILQNYYK